MFEFFILLKRLQYVALVFIGMMAFGTMGFYVIGGPETTFLDAFYMMGITISTVGFEEVVDLDSHPYGRLFTVILAFSGLGTLTYLISNIVGLFVDGEINRTFKNQRMQKIILKMENHYIICGCGRVGRNIALELYRTNRPFLVADSNEEKLGMLIKEIPHTPFIVGDCTDENFLLNLGAERAAGIFITTGDDNTNLVICLTAKQLNPRIKIIVRSIEIAHVSKLKRAGADRVVTPNHIGGLRMASEMLRPTVTHFLDDMMRLSLNQRFEELIIPQSLAGQPVEKLPISDLEETLIIAINEDEGWLYNPKKNHLLKEGSQIILLTNPVERQKLEERLK